MCIQKSDIYGTINAISHKKYARRIGKINEYYHDRARVCFDNNGSQLKDVYFIPNVVVKLQTLLYCLPFIISLFF